MNGRPSVVHQSLLTLGLLIAFSTAQVASAALIDASVKASTDGPTVRAAIDPFIQQQVANLQKDDATAQSTAREALVAEASGGPQKTASVFYMDSYAAALNTALAPLMKSQNMRVRLNAAITAARVAQAAQATGSGTSRLADIATVSMDDSSEAVVISGLQVARYSIPALAITATGKVALIDKVVTYVSAHPKATITQYGYNALSLDLIETARTRPWNPAQWNTALSKVIPAIQAVFRKRLDEYANGVPDDPQQERRAALLLTHQYAWNAQTPDQRQITLQLLVDLMSFASQRAVTAKDNQTRDQLVELIAYTARALKANGDQTNSPKLSAAVQPLQNFARGTTGEQAATAVQTAVQAIRAIPEFSKVKVPQVVRAVAVEIKPTTGPSTEQSILPASATQPSNAAPALPGTRPAGGAAPRTPAPSTHPAGAPKGGATPAGPAHTSAASAFPAPADLMS